MDINIEEIFKMTVFDYKDLDQIDIVKEVDLFEQIFDEPPKKEVKVNHDHPEQKIEKLGRNMRACRRASISETKDEKRTESHMNGLVNSNNEEESSRTSVASFKSAKSSVYISELDKLIRENKDSYFLKVLIQDNKDFIVKTN